MMFDHDSSIRLFHPIIISVRSPFFSNPKPQRQPERGLRGPLVGTPAAGGGFLSHGGPSRHHGSFNSQMVQ